MSSAQSLLGDTPPPSQADMEARAAAAAPLVAGPEAPWRNLPKVPGSKSLLGNFDAIDHGYECSGWVFDTARPMRNCNIQLRVDGDHLAQVEANLPRPDLARFKIRPECGFRITIPAAAFDGVIRRIEVWAMPDNVRIGNPQPLACVIADHKTYPKTFSVNSILRLEDGAIDYDRVFSTAFLGRHGVRAAVAYAYLWVLKRPPDRGGWDAYSDRILSGEIGIGTCLRELSGSDEAAKARRSGIDLRAEFEAIIAAAAKLPVDDPPAT